MDFHQYQQYSQHEAPPQPSHNPYYPASYSQPAQSPHAAHAAQSAQYDPPAGGLANYSQQYYDYTVYSQPPPPGVETGRHYTGGYPVEYPQLTNYAGSSHGIADPMQNRGGRGSTFRGRGGGGGRGNFVNSRGRGRGKRKLQTPHQQPPPVHKLPKQPKPHAWCDICRVDCNSVEILEQHKAGKKHKRTVQRLQDHESQQQKPLSVPVPPVLVPVPVPEQGAEKRTRSVDRGTRGKRIKRFGEYQSRPVPVPVPVPKVRPVVCTLCSVNCDTPAVFEAHLAGKKHVTRVNKFQRPNTVFGPIMVYIPPNQPVSVPNTGPEPIFYGLTTPELIQQHEMIVGELVDGGEDEERENVVSEETKVKEKERENVENEGISGEIKVKEEERESVENKAILGEIKVKEEEERENIVGSESKGMVEEGKVGEKIGDAKEREVPVLDNEVKEEEV